MAQESIPDERMARIWKDAISKVDNAVAASKKSANASLGDLVDPWISTMSNPAFPTRPVRRQPAAIEAILEVERKLGHELPAQVREFYLLTDGLDWVRSSGRPMSFGGHFPHLTKLGLARDLRPPFAEQLQRNWVATEEPEEPKHVALHGPGALAHMIEEPEYCFQFSELDEFLAIQESEDARCILVAHRNGLPVEMGTVLEVENLLATKYESIAHWLSAQVALYATIAQRP